MAYVSKSAKQTATTDDKQLGIELARRFLADPGNQQLREELAVYCQQRIVVIVRYLVVARGYHPPDENCYAFVEDACQDVLVKILEKTESLRSPENLFAWLREISFNVLVDAHRDAVGRAPEPRKKVDPEIKGEDGSPMSIFDVAEGRDAAMVHLAPSLTESADAERWTEKIHNRAVLERALAVHANSGKGRDFESALWIKETWDYPHATAEQIARLRNRSVGDTQHILHDDNEAIIPIAKYLVDSGAAEREWTDLTNDIQATMGENPATTKAEVLVDRWQKLGGDLPVMEDLRKQYADQANLPVPLSPSNEVRAFICSAVEVSKKQRGEKLSHD